MSNKEGEAMGGTTVKVRVCVAMDDSGSYVSSGWYFGDEPEPDSYHEGQVRAALLLTREARYKRAAGGLRGRGGL